MVRDPRSSLLSRMASPNTEPPSYFEFNHDVTNAIGLQGRSVGNADDSLETQHFLNFTTHNISVTQESSRMKRSSYFYEENPILRLELTGDSGFEFHIVDQTKQNGVTEDSTSQLPESVRTKRKAQHWARAFRWTIKSTDGRTASASIKPSSHPPSNIYKSSDRHKKPSKYKGYIESFTTSRPFR